MKERRVHLATPSAIRSLYQPEPVPGAAHASIPRDRFAAKRSPLLPSSFMPSSRVAHRCQRALPLPNRARRDTRHALQTRAEFRQRLFEGATKSREALIPRRVSRAPSQRPECRCPRFRSAGANLWANQYRESSESRDAQTTQHAADGGLHLSIDFAGGFVDGGTDQILEHFDVAGLYRLGIDSQTEQLLAAVHSCGDRSAARSGLDYGLLHFFLQGVVLRFGFRHQVLQVESTHGTSASGLSHPASDSRPQAESRKRWVSVSLYNQSRYGLGRRIFLACGVPPGLARHGLGRQGLV